MLRLAVLLPIIGQYHATNASRPMGRTPATIAGQINGAVYAKVHHIIQDFVEHGGNRPQHLTPTE